MPNLITVKIDVRKLDKARFFEGKEDRDGHKPLWCDLVLIGRREPGKYGDTHLVKQSKKKDEQVDLPIIGNATERGGAPAPASSRTETTTTMNGGTPSRRPAPASQDDGDQVPF